MSDFTFDSLTNKHPVRRRWEKIEDPRNDGDYDTFDYGTEPLPGDTTWAKYCKLKAGIVPTMPTWKDNCRPIHYPPGS